MKGEGVTSWAHKNHDDSKHRHKTLNLPLVLLISPFIATNLRIWGLSKIFGKSNWSFKIISNSLFKTFFALNYTVFESRRAAICHTSENCLGPTLFRTVKANQQWSQKQFCCLKPCCTLHGEWHGNALSLLTQARSSCAGSLTATQKLRGKQGTWEITREHYYEDVKR